MKILQVKTRGIKNLKDDLIVSFSNATINNGIKNISRIKGIYGYNGAGKSAFITSIELYVKLLRDRDYLLDSYNQTQLSKLINQSINEFFIEFIFFNDGNKSRVYKHSLLLSFDEIEQKYRISEEYFGVLTGRTVNDDSFSTIFSTFGEKLNVEMQLDDTFKKYYVENYYKSNGKSSLNTLFLKAYMFAASESKYTYDIKNVGPLLDLFILSFTLNTYLLNDDKHEPKLISKEFADRIIKRINDSENKKDLSFLRSLETNDEFEEVVFKKDFAKYKRDISYLENFIRIFKPELKKIAIKEKPDNGIIHCRKQFDYGEKGIVDIEYESSGIKHLVKLHKYLQGYIRGQMVFIDEMDVNINSVFLSKLVEFLAEVGKGQLCFTSHNLEPMNSIKNVKAAICAIGYDGKIDVWAKNGNKSPSNEYSRGDFEHSPFNVESFDFYSAFNLQEETL